MRESQESIGKWADDAFGRAPNPARIAARANEEMAELLRAATSDANTDTLIEECADVVIVLMRLAETIERDLNYNIDKKMERNRARVWAPDGTGHGYHVRVKAE